MPDPQTTIVAIATPPGRGGVGCIRLSGPDAHRIGAALFRPDAREGRDPAPLRPGDPPRFGRFVGRDGAPLDRGYLWLLAAARAFTGETTAELWPHGSPPVLAELVLAALAAGARTAGPGEFTYRALRNGRLDLSRAEAVRDLVDARTAWQARLAFAQSEGAVARRVEPLREALEEWIARGEAAVEFVEESDAYLTRTELRAGIERARATCAELLEGFRRSGRLARGGATLAIVGRPNAGKSSLFNRLLAADRAIVTEIPGTTRDTLEEELDLDGVPLRLIDTAGLRAAGDPVEAEGVRRAERARREADLVLVVLDRSRPPEEEERAFLAVTDDAAAWTESRVVVAANKCDLDPAWHPAERAPGAIEVSAKTGAGVDALRAELRARLVGEGPLEDPVLTDARHADAMERAGAALDRAAAAAAEGLSEELLLEDLREAMNRLGTIVGAFDVEDLYDRIFSTFCIGK